MKYWLVCILPLLAWVTAYAQASGRVVDVENNKPIAGVMVKAIAGGKTKAFATTNSEGEFNIPKAPLPCTLSFNHLSYDKLETEVIESNLVTYRLTPTNRQLEDVVVEAPRIVQRGDTTTYHLGRFVTKREVTVQDALKKLPGVEVSNSGTISYLGKAIDKLTIDGMDLLGFDYQSAIQSLKHEKVDRVEIMENQQDIKMLKDLVGDDKIVMNLVLNRNARGRANGKSEVGVGVDSRKEIAYKGMGHILYVQPRWQTTVEGKLERDFNATDEVQQSFTAPLTPSSPLIGSLPLGLPVPIPSISPHFYLRQKGGIGKLKSVYQFALDKTLNVDFSYSDYSTLHTYGNELTFLSSIGTEPIMLQDDRVNTSSRKQMARGMLRYKQNNQATYFSGSLDYVGQNLYQKDNVFTALSPLTQEVEQRSHLLQNNLRWSIRNGDKVRSLESNISFQTSPVLSLSTSQLNQRFSEQVAKAGLSTSFLFPLFNGWQLNIPLAAKYTSNVITKDGMDFSSSNRVDFSLSPTLWRFTLGENKISLSVPSTLAMVKHGTDNWVAHFLYAPTLNFMYRFNRVWSVNGRLNYNKDVGSELDLLRTPYFTNYRQMVLGSGSLRTTRGGKGFVSFDFRNPIQEIYGSISLAGRFDYADHLLADHPSNELNRMELVKSDNTSGNYNVSAYISRFFRKSKTKLSMGVNTQIAHYQSIRRAIFQKSRIASGGTWGEVQFVLSDHWSGEYHYTFSRNRMWYSDQRLAPLHSTTNKLEVTYSPNNFIHFSLLGEHQGKEIRAKELKHIFLLSAIGEYRSQIGNFKLHIHNILNMQEFGFTSYSATESNRSWYQLRGLSTLLSYTFYF